MGPQPANVLPLTHSSKFGFSAKATKWLPTDKSAAFGTFEQVWVFSKGNQMGSRQTELLPLTFLSKINEPRRGT